MIPRRLPVVLALTVGVLGMAAVPPPEPQAWITMRDGHLVYGTDAHGNRIPDFSTVGYEAGDQPIPDVPVRVRVQPDEQSADDTVRIQKAIDEAGALPLDGNGFRGAVLLGRGVFRVAGTLLLNRSGVVLRGSGWDKGGTHLKALGNPHRLIWVQGAGEWSPDGDKRPLTDEIVPVGATAISVHAAAGDFRPGERVIVQWSMPADLIHRIGMDRIAGRKDGREVTQWSSENMGLRFDRGIVSTTPLAAGGVRLQLDAALTQEMHRSDNAVVWRYTFPGRIRHVGIENLSADAAAFTHAADFDQPIEPPKSRDQPTTPHREDGSFFSSIFTDWDAVENGWMRDLYITHFNNIVVVDEHARALTFQGITGAAIDTPGHGKHSAPFAYQVAGQQILMQRCSIGGTLNHVWATQARVPGPNVFRDAEAVGSDLDAGPHQRWATGTLYEKLHLQGRFDDYNQEGLGTGHGWAGAWNVFYNDTAREWHVDSPPGAYNWVINLPQAGADATSALPPSLYKQQLAERHASQSTFVPQH